MRSTKHQRKSPFWPQQQRTWLSSSMLSSPRLLVRHCSHGEQDQPSSRKSWKNAAREMRCAARLQAHIAEKNARIARRGAQAPVGFAVGAAGGADSRLASSEWPVGGEGLDLASAADVERPLAHTPSRLPTALAAPSTPTTPTPKTAIAPRLAPTRPPVAHTQVSATRSRSTQSTCTRL
jgi:hypothetical protein